MIKNEHLAHAFFYFEGDTPYMKLVYEYENEQGIHKVTFPKVDFPAELRIFPTINSYNNESCRLCNPYFRLYSDINIHSGIVSTKEGPVNNVSYVDEIIHYNVHEMTLEDIEKTLGYPVKIISGKEK